MLLSESGISDNDPIQKKEYSIFNVASSLSIFSFIIIYFVVLKGVLFIIERPNVISSAYSNSSPIDMPRAITDNFTSTSASLREMKKFVVSPSIVVLSANITSITSSLLDLSIRLSISRSEGPIPSIGDIIPPRTWKSPLYCCVASIAITSRMLSTTHIVDLSLDLLEHIRHVSVSEILWHSLQYLTSFFNVIIEFPKDSTLFFSCLSR